MGRGSASLPMDVTRLVAMPVVRRPRVLASRSQRLREAFVASLAPSVAQEESAICWSLRTARGVVHSANRCERDRGRLVLAGIRQPFPRRQRIGAGHG
jgi:hypothetical protein